MRVVNPYKIRLVTTGTTIEDKQIVIPVGDTFDGVGQNQQVEDYVEKLADDSINPIVDYEKMRYTPLEKEGGDVLENVNYDFYFYGKPIWDDYKITNKSSSPQVFDWQWGAGAISNDNRLIIYSTPTTFKYSVVGGVINWSLKNPFLSYMDYGATKIQSDMDNTILTDNEIKVQYEINNTAVTVITTPGFSYSNYEVVTTPSSSVLVNQIPTNIGIPPINIWERKINISGRLEVNGIQPGDTITIQVRTDTPGVSGHTEGYEFTYEGSSQESEGYYTSYTADDIQSSYIENSFKGYTNSYFRLDYYDSIIEESQNLLFTDILTVSEGTLGEALFSTKLNKQNYFLYWLKNDPIIEEQGYRDVYMTARFFNASTGLISQFFHLNDVYNESANPPSNPVLPTIDQYETKLKYTKIRLYKDYEYVSMFRNITSTLTISLTGGTLNQPSSWTVKDINPTAPLMINKLVLHEIRLK
tara:strand:+ start:344 stop:1756 length:1413 start_codon:yes stop_codon:yes gene_type:complete